MMFILKSCPRCSGDLYVDLEGEIGCLQCGYELKLAEKQEMQAKMRAEKERVPAAA